MVEWGKDGEPPWDHHRGTVELAELCQRPPDSKKLFFRRVLMKTIWMSYNGVTG